MKYITFTNIVYDRTFITFMEYVLSTSHFQCSEIKQF